VIIFYFGCVEVTDPLLIVWIGLGGLGVNILGMILFAGNTTNQLIDGNKNMSNEVEGLCFSF
jgi:Na+-transporting methylmalonyl-CoA/oxaloacetate decarboxylase beta subunit